VTWNRAPAAAALADLLTTALAGAGIEASVFAAPPFTLNANAVVVSRPTEVRYAVSGFSIDEVTLPVLCVAGQDQDDTVSALIAVVRSALAGSLNLGGVVSQIHATGERNWRHVNVSGAELLAAELTVQILM
jgi:hypothetical protein